jgi:hypothetical protein
MRQGIVLLASPVLGLQVHPNLTEGETCPLSPRHPHVLIALGEQNFLVKFDLVEDGRKASEVLEGLLRRLKETGRSHLVYVNQVVVSHAFEEIGGGDGPVLNCAVVTLARDGRERIFDYQGAKARESAFVKAKNLDLEDGELVIVCESLWQASLPLDNEDVVDIPVLRDSGGTWMAMHTRTPGNSGAWCFRGEKACEQAKKMVRDLLFDRVDGCVSLRRVVEERISRKEP